MATIKKSAKKMQEGGKVKIKIKIKPDRKQAREDKDKLPLMGNPLREAEMKSKKSSLDKDLKDVGFKKIEKSKVDTSKKYMKKGGVVKAKNGKSFPDLNKDGKITKADILKGRGVIAKKGTSIRKAGLGDILGKVAGSGAFGLAGMAANKLFGGKKKTEAAPGMTSPAMKKGGKVAAKTMKSGGKMAKCKYGCK
jgi:hypothetical protein